MFLRTPVGTPRLFKVGRTGKLGRQPPPARGTAVLGPDVDTSKLSHVARRRIASPPMAKIERAVDAVGSAVQAWGDRFVDAIMRRTIPELIERADAINGMLHQERSDASVEDVFNSLTDPKVAKATLEEAFRAVDKASSDDLRVVGVRTGSVVPNADRLQSEWISRNTNLIKAQQDVRRRVERIISEEVPKGRSVADIRKLLEEQVGYARSRAELTARDQTLKLYGKIQQERQEAAGFTHYVWTTSLDERVREEHAELDGKVIAWDDPPVVDKRTGRREHPGGDYQCRCSAVPYTGDDVAEAEAPALEGDLPDVPFEVRLPEPPRQPAPPSRSLRPDVEPRITGGTEEQRATVSAALDRVGYRQFYAERVEPALAVRDIPGNALGVFNGNLNHLHVAGDPALLKKWARKKALPGPRARAPLEQLTDIARTPAEVQAITVAHEFGHAVHLTGQRWAGQAVFLDEQARRVDEIVQAAFARRTKLVTRYGDDAKEWFAEAFAAYHHTLATKAWLREWSPEAFDAVEAVLRERGMNVSG